MQIYFKKKFKSKKYIKQTHIEGHFFERGFGIIKN